MIISWIVAVGVLLGTGDMLLGNKFGLGKKFRQAFDVVGSMMLSLAGIMAFAPVLANCLKPVILPIFHAVRIDPGMTGLLLSNDMGGYQLAMSLAEDPRIGMMGGGITAGMIGGTMLFSVPFAFGVIEKEDRQYFFKGILIGICTMPIGSVVAGLLLGLPLGVVLWNNIPVIMISLLVVLGFAFCPHAVVKVMEFLGKAISCVGVATIGLGSFSYLTKIQVVPGMTDILDTMKIVCSMSITLFGMFPILELFGRAANPFLKRIESKTGLDALSCSGIIFITASSTPVYPVMKDMKKRGIVIDSAWVACCSGLFGSQLGLIMSVGREYLLPYLAARVSAGVTALVVAFAMTKDASD